MGKRVSATIGVLLLLLVSVIVVMFAWKLWDKFL